MLVPQSESYPTHQDQLSEQHRRMLAVESSIAPEVTAERGVRTIERGRELPPEFSWRQKQRAPGMLFTAHRPNGETAYSFRPDKPDPKNPGHKYEQPPKVYGGPGNVLDVHPSLHPLIENLSVPAFFVEGVKKADALTSAARIEGVEILAVAVSGVWNWLSDGEPISDMYAVPVEGRTVVIGFDSDMLRNPSVQDAARRLAEHLTLRGAVVWVTFFEDAPDGSKVGADDHFAAGGTIAGMRLLTRQYDPADFARVRLDRDGELRARVAALWAIRDGYPWKGIGGHTRRAAFGEAIERAARYGKVGDGGLLVPLNQVSVSEEIGVRRPTVGKNLRKLEEDGLIEKFEDAEAGKRSASYLLRSPADEVTRVNTAREKVTRVYIMSEREEMGKSVPLDSDSDSAYLSQVHQRCTPLTPSELEELKRLRWPFVERIRTSGGFTYTYRARYGKIAGHALERLVLAGGVAQVRDVIRAMGRADKPGRFIERYFRRMADDGIVILDATSETVRLAPGWRDRLHAARKRDGEIEAERLTKERNERSRRARREFGHVPADHAPRRRRWTTRDWSGRRARHRSRPRSRSRRPRSRSRRFG